MQLLVSRVVFGVQFSQRKYSVDSGADLGFSRRGGADFQKEIEKFDDLFLGHPN